jgi:hypothetical protein
MSCDDAIESQPGWRAEKLTLDHPPPDSLPIFGPFLFFLFQVQVAVSTHSTGRMRSRFPAFPLPAAASAPVPSPDKLFSQAL